MEGHSLYAPQHVAQESKDLDEGEKEEDAPNPDIDDTPGGYSSTLKDELSHYHEKTEDSWLRRHCCLGKSCDCIRNNLDSIIDTAGGFYDGITMTVSVIDLITDVLVLIEYYNKGYTPFFYSSLSILCFAQLSYCIAFSLKYADTWSSSFTKGCIVLGCLPFAPILSFVFYIVEDPNSCLARCLDNCCDCLSFDSNNNNNGGGHKQSVSKFRAWFEKKLLKHMGFILEASCEALPQSILQMIAIVYYNETGNILAIISIFTSLFSVISKSFVFSVSAGKDFITILFYWLCAITDFFGIFFAVTWVFYNPNRDNTVGEANDELISTLIGEIWFYKFLLIVLPLALVFTSIAGLWVLKEAIIRVDSLCECICAFVFVPIGVGFVMSLCLITLPIMLEIFVFLFIAIYYERTYMSRFPTYSASDMQNWDKIISFIYLNKGYDITDIANDFNHLSIESQFNRVTNSKGIKNSNSNSNNETPFACSAKQDRIIRICCLNYAYYKGYAKIQHLQKFDDVRANSGNVDFKGVQDHELREYLSKHQKSFFINVTQYNKILLHSGAGPWTVSLTPYLGNCDQDIDDYEKLAPGSMLRQKLKEKQRQISFWGKFWLFYGASWRQILLDLEYTAETHRIAPYYRRSEYKTRYVYQICLMLTIGLLTFILLPLYLISRIFSILFPIIIVIILSIETNLDENNNNNNNNNVSNVFAGIDTLQWMMVAIYSTLEVVVLIINGLLVYKTYYESLLLPNNNFASLEPFGENFVEYVTEYCYPRLIIAPIRDFLVRQVFGKDVGNLILSYLNDLSFEESVDDFIQFLIKYKAISKDHPSFLKIQMQGFGKNKQ